MFFAKATLILFVLSRIRVHSLSSTNMPILTYLTLSITGLSVSFETTLTVGPTSFDNQLSDPLDISASIVQGSAVGPASYVVTASDLHPVSSRNVIVKYADDKYLIIPANNQNTCKAEIQHIEQWADINNLKLNRSKSKEIVCTKPR